MILTWLDWLLVVLCSITQRREGAKGVGGESKVVDGVKGPEVPDARANYYLRVPLHQLEDCPWAFELCASAPLRESIAYSADLKSSAASCPRLHPTE